jgi:hypothetical protein
MRIRTTKKMADGPQARVRGLWADDRGISTFEYLLILLIILAGSIAAWHRFGETLNRKISDSGREIDRLEPGAAVEPGAGQSEGVLPKDFPGAMAVAANNNYETMAQEVDGEGTGRTATEGQVIPGEPITNPQVKAALLEAYENSHPVYVKDGGYSKRSEEEWPREQGLTGTKLNFFEELIGFDVPLERWTQGPKCDEINGCKVRIPKNIKDGSLTDDLLFTAHTHPVEDPDHDVDDEDINMYKKYFSSAPHYIVAPEGVYRLTMGKDGKVKTEFIGTRQKVLY